MAWYNLVQKLPSAAEFDLQVKKLKGTQNTDIFDSLKAFDFALPAVLKEAKADSRADLNILTMLPHVNKINGALKAYVEASKKNKDFSKWLKANIEDPTTAIASDVTKMTQNLKGWGATCKEIETNLGKLETQLEGVEAAEYDDKPVTKTVTDLAGLPNFVLNTAAQLYGDPSFKALFIQGNDFRSTVEALSKALFELKKAKGELAKAKDKEVAKKKTEVDDKHKAVKDTLTSLKTKSGVWLKAVKESGKKI